MDSESQSELSESQDGSWFLYEPGEMAVDYGNEGRDRYRTGGLHPVHLNDIVSASSSEEASKAPEGKGYRILHKLGLGSFSHVWFGQNLDPAHPGHRGAALKFIASKQTGKTHEVEINRFLAEMHRSQSQDSGSQNFALCLETFQINGPNGIHDVIVSEPALLISDIIYNNIIAYLDEHIIFKQTLSGLGFLHKHGVVHRDLHLNNIAIELPFMRSTSVSEIMQTFGHPRCNAIVPMAHTTHSSSVPQYTVERAEFPKHFWTSMPILEPTSFNVKIIDFGRAFRPEMHDTPDPEQGRPVLRPPECNLRTMIPKKLPSESAGWHPTTLFTNAGSPSFDPGKSGFVDGLGVTGLHSDYNAMLADYNAMLANYNAKLASREAAWLDDSSPLADCAGNNQQFSTSTQLPEDTGLGVSLSTKEQERAALLKFDRAWSAYRNGEEHEAAPESPDLSDLVWSPPGDIWVVGCTLFLILVRDQFNLFRSLGGAYLFRDIAHYLGPVPDRYRVLLEAGAKVNSFEGRQCSEVLDIDRSLSDPLVIDKNWSELEQEVHWYRQSRRRPKSEPLSSGASERGTAPLENDEEEKKRVRVCLQLIRRMLKWSPEDRISASDAADSLCTQEPRHVA